ncbi:hypothetical protein PUN28_009403 [Cardiocondyla obscurior]|uniref:Uncharacterized protein n=1 Tax=Cardiocondyla obscurior TaxID=286306 RepID=A0AAW2FSD2_9HYME
MRREIKPRLPPPSHVHVSAHGRVRELAREDGTTDRERSAVGDEGEERGQTLEVYET